MGTVKLFKMLWKSSDWANHQPFGQCPDLIEVKHSSGIYFFKDCWAGVIRNEQGQVISEGFLNWAVCGIAVVRLNWKLD